MKRLSNAIAQRDEAREEVLISQAKIKQFQQQLEKGLPVTPITGLQASSPTARMAATTAGRENAPPTSQRLTTTGRPYEVSDTEILSEMDRRQRELYNKQQKLLREQRENDQKRLLSLLQSDLGFQDGRPVAAVLVFRCCLHWKAFQANHTPLFDRINQTMGEQVENLQEDNSKLAYWLSNTVALLYLMQKYIKPAASSGASGRQRQLTPQSARGLFGSAGKSISAYFGIGMGSPSGEASIHGGARGGTLRQVEAKYPALLFKQQLDAFVQRIFPMLRDNVKKEITPYLGACIHAPRGGHGGRPLNRKAPESSVDSSSDGSIVASWRHILSVFDKLLVVLQENHVPTFLVRKLFEQLFNFVNVQLFNQLLLRRECCSFSNGEYVKTGLAEVELWVANAGREWLGDSWDMLAHIRQAVGFLVIHQKAKKTLSEITQDLCPALSVQQLYRISTMYFDDRYGTETVSHEVLSKMKQLMVEGVASSAASHSFLLDDDSTIPFTQEDISTLLDDNRVLADLKVPKELKEVPSFAFLEKSTAAEIQATSLVN